MVEKTSKQWLPLKKQERTFWDDDNVLYLDRSLGFTSICICQDKEYTLIFICFTKILYQFKWWV